MAVKGPKGSILLELLIVLMALLLIAVILIPDSIWEEENKIANTCRDNMNALYEAELFYNQANNSYTDSLSKLLTVIQSDTSLQQKQTIVSLTRSFLRVVRNILEIPSINEISTVSKSSFEITGDLVGNERYFRKYEDIMNESQEIIRDMSKFDSSEAFPNFCRTKLFVDSLQSLSEQISDYTLQNGILNAINYTDSINLYFDKIERDKVSQFWDNEYDKIMNFINEVKQTDIVKVSSVGDRLRKFINRIDRNIKNLSAADITEEKRYIEAERQNLTELHQKFLSPEFFIITQRYGLKALPEIDSILINLSQNDFYCPDNDEIYLIDTTHARSLIVECPNLLDQFHNNFQESIDPIRELPLFTKMNQLDTVIQNTIDTLNHNRLFIRRYTDALLKLKEILAEFDQLDNVFFYHYMNELQDFIRLVNNETQLSVLKPAIEDILNPMDTLAARIETKNISDLEDQLNYYHNEMSELDSTISELPLRRSDRRKIVNTADFFKKAMDITETLKSDFSQSYATALRDAADALERNLLDALEGADERKFVIFKKTHINHGYIMDEEKSWEQE